MLSEPGSRIRMEGDGREGVGGREGTLEREWRCREGEGQHGYEGHA